MCGVLHDGISMARIRTPQSQESTEGGQESKEEGSAKMKTKAHTRYRNANNEIVPGVTTIVGLLDKPALVPAANKLGLQGIDSRKAWGNLAEIGTLGHAMVMDYLKGEETDTSDYSKEQIDKAENSYLSWLEWKKAKKIEPIGIEVTLVSEKHQFGGCFDFLGTINDTLILADYKTGGIWREHYIQLCGYYGLLLDNGYLLPEKGLILGIPRTLDEKFQEVYYTEFERGWQIFLHLREVYDLLKGVK